MKRHNKISQLLAKEILRITTPEEKRILEDWGNRKILDRVESYNFINADTDSEYLKLENRIKKNLRIKIFKYSSLIAASVLIIIGIRGIILYKNITNNTAPCICDNAIKNNPHKEVVLLSDDESFSLTKLDTTILKNSSIRLDKDSVVRFEDNKAKVTPHYNKIVVPVGGDYNFYLSDGTHVFLNSKSKIEFPNSFVGNKREVKLEGEGYFIVAKNKAKPFIVATKSMKVKVTGTSFNVRAYDDENNIQTTLVEGGVDVYYGGDDKVSIKPGQQALLDERDNSIIVKDVNTEVYKSWVNGEFYFDDMRVEDIMRNLSRWYDVEVFYQNEEAKDITYSGKFKKHESIDKIITILNTMEYLKIVKNKKVVIVQKK